MASVALAAVPRPRTLRVGVFADAPLQQQILPAEQDGILGLHTVNRAGALTVVDGFAQRARI